MPKGGRKIPKNPPAQLKPRLKLFFSADLIGSTAYKQRLYENDDPRKLNWSWQVIIQNFYDELPSLFDAEWTKLRSKLAGDDEILCAKLFGEEPVFWKTIGDEIVFWKELTCDLQVWTAIAAWFGAIAGMRESFAKSKHDDLDLKSAIWAAEFPVRNRTIVKSDDSAVMVPLAVADIDPANPDSIRDWIVRRFYGDTEDRRIKGLVDFVGPGIDIGFRLGAFASSRKMMISLDVAYLMAITAERIGSIADADIFEELNIGRLVEQDEQQFKPFGGRLDLHYSGTHFLKGVVGGVTYPLFWINTEVGNSIDNAKSQINAPRLRVVNWTAVLKFCNAYYKDRRKFLKPPFVYSTSQKSIERWNGGYDPHWWTVAREIDSVWYRARSSQPKPRLASPSDLPPDLG